MRALVYKVIDRDTRELLAETTCQDFANKLAKKQMKLGHRIIVLFKNENAKLQKVS